MPSWNRRRIADVLERVARGQLAQLHEAAVLDPVLEDALRSRVESGRQLARIAVRQQLALVLFRVARDAGVLRARREIHDLVAEHAVEQRRGGEASCAIVNSLRNDPIQFGFGSPMTVLSESLQLPPLMAWRCASVAPMSTV